MGLAGSLLVFTGLWHALEWLMSERNKDTARLIPFGIIYIILGYLIVTLTGGNIVLGIALIITTIGLILAYKQRNVLAIRQWVIWAFIIIDALIIIGILSSFLI